MGRALCLFIHTRVGKSLHICQFFDGNTADGLPFMPLVIIMFRKKDGGTSVVTKDLSAIGMFFFDNHYKKEKGAPERPSLISAS
jgi:hypothetical protein